MKIIISPSKLQRPLRLNNRPCTPPIATNATLHLSDALMRYEEAHHQRITDVLGKPLGYNTEMSEVGHAIATYNGIVYHEIDYPTYDELQWGYIENHLRILSAFYGVLTPLTLIRPYRLDMSAKIPGINLYHFWQKTMDDVFSHEDLIVDLASKEFSKLLDLKKFKGSYLKIDFKEEQSDGQYKIVTVHAKQARGLMANYMVDNLVEDVSQLQHFSESGYAFDHHRCEEGYYLFVRPYGWQSNHL